MARTELTGLWQTQPPIAQDQASLGIGLYNALGKTDALRVVSCASRMKKSQRPTIHLSMGHSVENWMRGRACSSHVRRCPGFPSGGLSSSAFSGVCPGRRRERHAAPQVDVQRQPNWGPNAMWLCRHGAFSGTPTARRLGREATPASGCPVGSRMGRLRAPIGGRAPTRMAMSLPLEPIHPRLWMATVDCRPPRRHEIDGALRGRPRGRFYPKDRARLA